MDVRLSPEQQALRDSAAQVVDRLGPHAVGQLDDAERAAKLDAAVAASGWRELRLSEDGGSPLASGVEVAIVAEQLGRGAADAAFVGPTLAAELRRLAGTSAATASETVMLDGIAIDAAGSTSALVVDGGHLCEVALGPAEVAVDLTRAVAAPTGAATAIAELDDDDLVRWEALGLAVTAADLVGVMDGATRLATAYAKERRQYGAAIGSFQAVQHLLADAYVWTEGSRSVTLHAAWAVDALPAGDALAAAAVAKAYCARAARTVCETAVQVHGGVGNTWECMAHVYLRRALLSTELFGGVGESLAHVLSHHGIGGR